jgi:hypothetical protein
LCATGWRLRRQFVRVDILVVSRCELADAEDHRCADRSSSLAARRAFVAAGLRYRAADLCHGILPAMYTRHQPSPADAQRRFALRNSTLFAPDAAGLFSTGLGHAFD